MFRLFILPFLLLFVFCWLFGKAFLIFIEVAYAVVCFLLMLGLAVTVAGFSKQNVQPKATPALKI